ncbi:suppressor of loss of ypt1 [Rhizophlyctis rosea]|nr:suppressor of loss of ypt1 [Rhizophlyctis rosea]
MISVETESDRYVPSPKLHRSHGATGSATLAFSDAYYNNEKPNAPGYEGGIQGDPNLKPYPPAADSIPRKPPHTPKSSIDRQNNVNINITYNTQYNIHYPEVPKPGSTSFDPYPRPSHTDDIGKTPDAYAFIDLFLEKICTYLPPSMTADTLRFCLLCCIWYSASALSNNLEKQTLNIWSYPMTLTYVQFGMVAILCLVTHVLGFSNIRRPTVEIVKTVLPLALFQIAGHVFSSYALSVMSVAISHTIKALSPLFTVGIYRLIFQIGYSPKVYTALIPLTGGVIIVCNGAAKELTFTMAGCLCALTSTIIFVAQNIWSKKLFNDSSSKIPVATGARLDKMNLLFYSAALAFVMMFPLWFYTDGFEMLFPLYDPLIAGPPPAACMYILMDGATHFAQSVIAFSILAIVSPITYSIAALVKRICVIVASIIWFGEHVNNVEKVGILLTFVGLYLYDRAKENVNKGEAKIAAIQERRRSMSGLPLPMVSRKGEETLA